MNLAGTEYSLNDKSFDIFVSGCSRACPGCFNPEAQDYNYGEPLDLLELIRKITDHEHLINSIRIMGGDLLCQPEKEANRLSWALRLGYPQMKLWLFTGAELKEVPKWCLKVFDVIKTGKYIRGFKQDSGLASSNQKYHYKGSDY
jgi:anaerobic ribonucleoside-triphosphate reductase activating protein